MKRYTDEPQKLDIRLFRQAVQPVNHDLCEVGKQLQQHHSRVVRRMVRPSRAGVTRAFDRILEELIKRAVI